LLSVLLGIYFMGYTKLNYYKGKFESEHCFPSFLIVGKQEEKLDYQITADEGVEEEKGGGEWQARPKQMLTIHTVFRYSLDEEDAMHVTNPAPKNNLTRLHERQMKGGGLGAARKYLMYYRGPGFVPVASFSSFPFPCPLSCQHVVSLSQPSCVSPVKFTDVGGGGGKTYENEKA
jgi:hypothetical protein